VTAEPIDFGTPAPGLNGTSTRDHTEEWEEPIPFDEFNAPAFPVDVLPDDFLALSREQAVALQVPIDLPSLLTLAMASLAISKKIAVEVKPGWVEPTNLYTAIALAPGEGKSPTFNQATAEARAWECRERARLAPRVADAMERASLLDERIKELKRKAAREKQPTERERHEADARELAVRRAELRIPALPRLVADDATPEAVGRLLGEQGGRLGIFSSEGRPLAILAGRYSEGRANLELFCKAHSGDPYCLDRINRPSIILRAPLLTIALTVQRSIIGGLASTPEMRGQGLLARFIYSIPESRVGSRDADPPQMANATRDAYELAIRRLLDLNTQTDEQGEIVTRTIPLSHCALAALIEFKTELEPRLGLSGDLHAIADWGNKLTGTVARLAGVLHAADHAGREDLWAPIERGAVERAIAIAEIRDSARPRRVRHHGRRPGERVGEARARVGSEERQRERQQARDSSWAARAGQPRRRSRCTDRDSGRAGLRAATRKSSDRRAPSRPHIRGQPPG
jgi:uncharacterized protein DUF3987